MTPFKKAVLSISVALLSLGANAAVTLVDIAPTAELVGKDIDGNGIRDSVDKHIQDNFKDPKQREAVERLAKTMQSILTVQITDDNPLVYEIPESVISSMYQLAEFIPVEQEVVKLVSTISDMTFDTPGRIEKRVRFGAALKHQKASILAGKAHTPEHLKKLQGEDADNNGVRDDVDKLIATKFKDPTERKAISQYAKAFQRAILLDTTSPVASKDLVSERDKAIECLSAVFKGDVSRVMEGTLEVETLSANTPERKISFARATIATKGVPVSPARGEAQKDSCD